MNKLSKRFSCFIASKRVWSLVSAGIILGSVPVFADNNLNSVDEKLNSVVKSERMINMIPITNSIDVQIDETDVNFKSDPYIMNDVTFVPVRELAKKLNVEEVKWDDEREVVTLIYGDKYIELYVNTTLAKVNDEIVEVGAPISIYNDRSYIPVRLVAETFDCEVDWDNSSKTVIITTDEYEGTPAALVGGRSSDEPINNKKVTETSNLNYSQEDLYWLSRLVEAEASGEPFSGKLGVANVIINRKSSPEFPNTIKGAIFDTNYGVQFTPTANGTIYNQPSEDSIKAARMALEGTNNVGDCLYFVNPIKATNKWIMNNRQKYNTIALHDFYL